MSSLFTPGRKVIVGMVHLLPLPGSPRFRGSMREIIRRARSDLRALLKGGVDAVLIENFGDAPYPVRSLPLISLMAMAYVVGRLAQEIRRPFGINIQFNQFKAEVALAAASGAQFVRVEGFVDNLLTDSGWSPACAAEVSRLRAQWAKALQIWADIHVKEAIVLGERPLVETARAAIANMADVLIVTGAGTGVETPVQAVEAVKAVAPCPVLIGSGLNPSNAAHLLRIADGAIVGTYFKKDGRVGNPVDPERVAELVTLARRLED
jgi:membrane complex biogenesis BtpA family protein